MKTLKRILITVAIITSILIINGCYYVFNGQFRSVEKLNSGQDLNLYECFSAYTMHMATWILGWPLSPTAAYECMTLHFPHRDETTVINNEYLRAKLATPKIIRAMRSLKDSPVCSSVRVAWNGNEAYSVLSPEHNAAIAVNPCIVTKELIMDDGTALYTIRSSMQYPKYSESKFNIGPCTITIHEGLFRHLQDRHWLSCYTAEYGLYESMVENALK